jgi:hypothetical protein
MALPSRLNITHGDAFEHGALGVKIEALNDYEKVKAGVQDPQQRDKDTGERIWLFRGIDNDPDARSSEFKVKIVAPVMPADAGRADPGHEAVPGRIRGADGHSVRGGDQERVHPGGVQPQGHRCSPAADASLRVSVKVQPGRVRDRHGRQESSSA